MSYKNLIIESRFIYARRRKRRVSSSHFFCPIPPVVREVIYIHIKYSSRAEETNDNSIHYGAKLRVNDRVSIVTGHVVTCESVANRRGEIQNWFWHLHRFITDRATYKKKLGGEPRAPSRPIRIIIINYMRITDTTLFVTVLRLLGSRVNSRRWSTWVQVHDLDGFLIGSIEK